MKTVDWSLASSTANTRHQPSWKVQSWVRSGHKMVSYTRSQLDSLPGSQESQRQLNWKSGRSMLFSILFQSTQADIHKYEFYENFILMLFSLCKVIPSVLTSCLTSFFVSEMPSCEKVEKNRTVPCYCTRYLLGKDLNNLASRSHGFMERLSPDCQGTRTNWKELRELSRYLGWIFMEMSAFLCPFAKSHRQNVNSCGTVCSAVSFKSW